MKYKTNIKVIYSSKRGHNHNNDNCQLRHGLRLGYVPCIVTE